MCEPGDAVDRIFPAKARRWGGDLTQLDDEPTADSAARLSVMWRALTALRRPRHSISGRLMFVVLLTTVLALLVAGGALLVTDLRDSRPRLGGRRQHRSGHSRPQRRTRTFLRRSRRRLAQPERAVSEAVHRDRRSLYATGDLYTYYARVEDVRAPQAMPELSAGVYTSGEPVDCCGRSFRTASCSARFICNRATTLPGASRRTPVCSRSVLVLSLTVALLASGWLQHVIAEPTEAIASAARGIVERRDYSLRARK